VADIILNKGDRKMNDFEQFSGDRFFEKIMIGVGVIVAIIAFFTL